MARTRLNAAERRQSIVDVARTLFSEKGYHGVSVDEIVGKVGVSPAILYRHFGSKEELYATVLQETSCQRESYVDAVVGSSLRFEEVLNAMTLVYVRSIANEPDLLRMELHSFLEGNEATRQFFRNRWKSFTDFIDFSMRERLRDSTTDASDPVDGWLDGRVAGLIYQGMVREALLSKCLDAHDRFPDIGLEDLVKQLVRSFIRLVEMPRPRISRRAVVRT